MSGFYKILSNYWLEKKHVQWTPLHVQRKFLYFFNAAMNLVGPSNLTTMYRLVFSARDTYTSCYNPFPSFKIFENYTYLTCTHFSFWGFANLLLTHHNFRRKSHTPCGSFDWRSPFVQEFQSSRRYSWQWPPSSGRNNLKKEVVDSSETSVYLPVYTASHSTIRHIISILYVYVI